MTFLKVFLVCTSSVLTGCVSVSTYEDTITLIARENFAESESSTKHRLSPDGKYFAFERVQKGVPKLLIATTACGSCPEALEIPLENQRPIFFNWTLDSQRIVIFHAPRRPGESQVSTFTLNDRKLEPLLANGYTPLFIASDPLVGHAFPHLVFRSQSGDVVRVETTTATLIPLNSAAGLTPVAV